MFNQTKGLLQSLPPLKWWVSLQHYHDQGMHHKVFETEKNKRKLKLETKCGFKEFIENHVKVMPGYGHIKLTSAQHAFIDFIDFIEKNKGKKIIWSRSRSGGLDCITKLYKEYVSQNNE